MTVTSGSGPRAADGGSGAAGLGTSGNTTPSEGRRSWRMRAKSLLFGLFGLALLVGLPVLLWAVIGNPIDRFPQSLSEASDLFQRRYVPSDVIIGILAIVLWLVWLQFVWALIWEVAVVGPAATRGALARSAPLAPRIVRSVASSVVSGMLAATVVVGSSSLASVGSHVFTTPAALATDAQIRTVEPASSTAAGGAAVGQAVNRVHTVGASESLWSIAKRNDAMVKRLLELNEDKLRSPIDVRPGMELLIPVSLLDESPAPVPSAASADAGQDGLDEADDDLAADPMAAEHVVVTGDNLWNISKADLKAAGDDEPSNREVAERVSQLVARNRDVVEDPDLIYPGEVIELREASAGPRTRNPSEDPGGSADQDVGEIAPADLPAADSSSAPSAPADRTRQVGSETETAAGAGPEPVTAPQDDTAGLGIEAAVVASGFGSVIAASGLLLRFLRLRRKRSSSLGAGSVRREGLGDPDHPLSALATASDLEFTRWAAGQLQTLFASLPESVTAAPVSVRLATASWLSAESGVSVLWDSPMASPVAGWQAATDTDWFRPYDDTRSTSFDPGPAAIPGLISLGEIASGPGERELLLVDLEAFGSLAIGGTAAQLKAAAQAIAFEAGSGELLSNIAVTTVDFDIDGADDLERVSSCAEELALAHAETIVSQYQSQLSSARFGSSANGQHDVELFIVNTVQANTDRWLDIATPYSGVAVLLLGDMRSSRLGARLTVDSDGVGTLAPLDLRLNVHGLLPEVAQQVGELFDRVLEPSDWPQPAPVTTGGEVVAGWSDGGDQVGSHAGGAVRLARAAIGLDRPMTPTGDADAADRLRLTVLGRCRCEELPDLAARSLSLVAFLAVQPEMAATKASIIEAVWGGRSVSDGQFSKVVAAARAQLGPERLPKQLSNDGLFRLDGVETDLHALQHLALRIEGCSPVEAAPLLRQATDLIDGPPFGGVTLDWAAGCGLIDYAAELIESVTIQAVEAMVAVGDLEAAGVAATRGLVALPTNEPIHRTYMRIAADLDDPVRVRSTFDQLQTSLSLLHPTESVTPSQETTDLHDELMARLATSLEPTPPVPPVARSSQVASPVTNGAAGAPARPAT